MNITSGNARFDKDLIQHVKGLRVYIGDLRRKAVYVGRRFWKHSKLTLAACYAAATVSLPSAVRYNRLGKSRIKDSQFSPSDCSTIDGLTPYPEAVQIRMPTLSRAQSRKVDVLEWEADDTVVVKVGIVGDCETGKTSFMENYVGIIKRSDRYVPTAGMVSMQKIVTIRNAKILFSLWELGGYGQDGLLPIVCQDAAALLFVFDLTRRSTLNSVKEWFLQARVYNKAAMPILIGTKYDQFVKFPDDIQFTIIQQATQYAQTMCASLFFSSVTHNINVQKIFKVIAAKLFDLPCHISKNHTFGEPIIDF